MTIDAPGFTGRAAVWTFTVRASGDFSLDSATLDRLFVSAFRNTGELPNSHRASTTA